MEIKLGICQLKVQDSKQLNMGVATEMIAEAVEAGADIVALPEMFNCPYQKEFFPDYAETAAGETVIGLAELAAKYRCYLVGGSIPEYEAGRIYNSAFVFDRAGRVIAKHRKVHLFDIDIPGKISFKESAVLSPGDQVTSFSTEYGECGLAICYDVRFPELFRLLAAKDTRIIFIPAAFNLTTGPAHWETLMRARAIDNQQFVVGISPARNEQASYQAYGHSLVVDPWGKILWQADETQIVQVVSLNLEEVDRVRNELPVLSHRRHDLYQVLEKTK